jgi:RimJ/RimL family protein N-acetyltransferase
MHATPITMRLREGDRAALESHFLALDGEDRRLRFGSNIGDEALHEYVERIHFERDGVFAVQDDELHLLAVIHIAFGGGTAELGLSVAPHARGQGLGTALFRRAVMHLRNRGTLEVFVHCLTENGAMMHIARKHRMRIIRAGAESDARLALQPPTAQSMFTEWLHDHHAEALTTVRRNALLSRAVLGYLAPQFTR